MGTGEIKAGERVARACGLPCIDMREILQAKRDDEGYLQRHILQTCFEKDIDIPTSLLVELLEPEIKKVTRPDCWTLILGFPNTREQFDEFREKVQVSNPVFWLETPGSQTSTPLPPVDEALAWRSLPQTFKMHLKASASFFKELSGSPEQLEGPATESIRAFIQEARVTNE